MAESFHEVSLHDEDVMNYALDDELLSPEVETHLQDCKICMERLLRCIQVNKMLQAKLYRSRCPDITHLTNYCSGLLPLDDIMQVEEHLQECPLCSREAQEIYELLR